MSNEEDFEEIQLENARKSTDQEEDDKSEQTDFTNKKERSASQINHNFNTNNADNSNNVIIIPSPTPKVESKFYYEFMDSNKDFFERIGFKDISNDPIFELTEELELNKSSNTNSCEVCKKEISRIFSRTKFCKFCGNVLCDKCSNLKRQIPKCPDERLATICPACEHKFINYLLHEDFKDRLTQKEFEITEFNQKLEKFSLIYSEQLDEVNKLNEMTHKRKRDNETKEEMLITETNNLKKRTEEACNTSEKQTIKINESINILRSLEDKKKNLEKEYNNIQKDRENITFECEKKQNYLDEVLGKINQLSMTIKNQQQNNQKDNNNNISRRETGNKKLDMLLKEKMRSQRKLMNESHSSETTIIINPSKIITEIYNEPLLSKSAIEKKEGAFKRFILFMGSKIFIKE